MEAIFCLACSYPSQKERPLVSYTNNPPMCRRCGRRFEPVPGNQKQFQCPGCQEVFEPFTPADPDLVPKNYGITFTLACKHCGGVMNGTPVGSFTAVQPAYTLACPRCRTRLLLFSVGLPGYPYLRVWRDELSPQGSFSEQIAERMKLHILAIEAKRATKH